MGEWTKVSERLGELPETMLGEDSNILFDITK